MLIQKNPITMVGLIDRCWLFTYQTPADEAERLLPYPLLPVTHRGFAFWNVVVCHVDRMRPKGLPPALGMSYWHVAYRLYVRYPAAVPGCAARLPAVDGAEVQGLYFVRSDCDSRLMSTAGNVMTDFNFNAAGVNVDGGQIEIGGDAPATAVVHDTSPIGLPPNSAFDHLDQAARFLKYKPFGISVDAHGNGNIVRIVRDERQWHARLVDFDANFAFLAGKNTRPEICYEVDPIQYQWNRAYRVRPLALPHKYSRDSVSPAANIALDR